MFEENNSLSYPIIDPIVIIQLTQIRITSAFKAGSKFFPLDRNGIFELADFDPAVTWKAMESLLQTGKTKAIGVSNFNVRRLKLLLREASIVPAINQIEAHPYLQQPTLFNFCKTHNIQVAAYSPLGHNQTGEPRTVDDAKVHQIAESMGMDPGQVLVSWGVQRGTVVLPKSVTPSRIASNLKDEILPDDIMAELNALERGKRFNFPARWGVDVFDEAGTDVVRKIAKEAGEENKTKFTV